MHDQRGDMRHQHHAVGTLCREMHSPRAQRSDGGRRAEGRTHTHSRLGRRPCTEYIAYGLELILHVYSSCIKSHCVTSFHRPLSHSSRLPLGASRRMHELSACTRHTHRHRCELTRCDECGQVYVNIISSITYIIRHSSSSDDSSLAGGIARAAPRLQRGRDSHS
jgi:hypothetical protein